MADGEGGRGGKRVRYARGGRGGVGKKRTREGGGETGMFLTGVIGISVSQRVAILGTAQVRPRALEWHSPRARGKWFQNIPSLGENGHLAKVKYECTAHDA